MNVLNNHHAPLVPFALSIAGWLSGVQPMLTAILTVITISWYARMFYKDWKAERERRKSSPH